MRRRVFRLISGAGLIAPTLVVVAAQAQTSAPSVKEGRGREAAPATARLVPTPGDVAPDDPVGAAFELFPARPAEERPVGVEATTVVTTAVAATALPRKVNLPMPRPRPADLGTGPTVEATLEVASLAPESVTAPRPAAAPIAAETAVIGEPKKVPAAAEPYMALLRREAVANKVPLWLAVGVGWVESKYQPNLRGRHGVVGLMQVMPSTARFQGYRGPTEKLLDPETNIVWGMKELGWDWAKSGGNACLAIAKYKGGIATKRISSAAADYCKRAKAVTGMG